MKQRGPVCRGRDAGQTEEERREGKERGRGRKEKSPGGMKMQGEGEQMTY